MNLKDQFWNDEKVIDFYFMYYHLGGLMNKTDLQAHIDIFKGPQLEPFFTPIYDGDELPDTTIDEHPMWLEVDALSKYIQWLDKQIEWCDQLLLCKEETEELTNVNHAITKYVQDTLRTCRDRYIEMYTSDLNNFIETQKLVDDAG